MCFRCFVVMYKFWIFIYLSVEEGDDIKELHVFLLVFDRETPMKKLFGKVFWARGNVRTRGWDYNSQSWTVKGLHLVSWTELKIVFLTNFSGRIYLCCCLVGKILFWLFQVVRGTWKGTLAGRSILVSCYGWLGHQKWFCRIWWWAPMCTKQKMNK